MSNSKNKSRIVPMSDFYIPPIAIRPRWMGHPSSYGCAGRKTMTRGAEVAR